MVRYVLACCLFGLPMLSGCSNGYYVNTADFRAYRRTMVRYSLACCLLGLPLVSSCSNGYYIDAADFRAAPTALSGRVVPAERKVAQAVRKLRAQPTTVIPPVVPEFIRTVGHGEELRPWPQRGSPEWDRV